MRTRRPLIASLSIVAALVAASAEVPAAPGSPADYRVTDPLWLFPVPEGIHALDTWGDGLAVGDLDGDGFDDIVVGTVDGQAIAIDGHRGRELWRYRIAPKAHDAAVDIVDLNRDGRPEVIAVATADPAEVHVLDRLGRLEWRLNADFNEITDLAYGDVDSDGAIDIFVANRTYPLGGCVIVAGGADGERLQTIPIDRPLVLDSHDLTGDGIVDVVAAEPNRLWLLDVAGDGGWTIPFEGPAFGADLIVADVSADGRPEILSGGAPVTCFNTEGEVDWCARPIWAGHDLSVGDVVDDGCFRYRIEVVYTDSQAARLFMLDGLTGELMWAEFGVFAHALGDVTGDFRPEILVGAFNPLDVPWLPYNYVAAIDGDQNVLWMHPLKSVDRDAFSLVSADLVADPQMEVVVANGDHLLALDVHTLAPQPAPATVAE